jgi:hypothetical protein
MRNETKDPGVWVSGCLGVGLRVSGCRAPGAWVSGSGYLSVGFRVSRCRAPGAWVLGSGCTLYRNANKLHILIRMNARCLTLSVSQSKATSILFRAASIASSGCNPKVTYPSVIKHGVSRGGFSERRLGFWVSGQGSNVFWLRDGSTAQRWSVNVPPNQALRALIASTPYHIPCAPPTDSPRHSSAPYRVGSGRWSRWR